MKAMILAAGLGTRLRPLTTNKPKALIPVINRPIIGRTIDYLKTHGVTRIVVNAHHHFQQILDYLNGGRPFGMDIEVLVEPEILGTGGGIKNASDFWGDEPFIVINSDILTDIDLGNVYEYHKKSGCIATLALHDYEPFNQIRIDNNQKIIDIAPNKAPGRLAFTCIHIMDPDLLSYIPGSGYSDIIDCYRRLIRSNKTIINAYLAKGHYWRDIGNVDSYIRANKEILDLDKESFSVGAESKMDSSVKFEGWVVVGENTYIEKDVEISRSILWDNVRVNKGIKITDSIVTSSSEVDNDLIEEIY
ncbi:MAG: NDP-sugar synthase [Deltaproteobacteria bacterium]|nr:NDP-sugar synthase [Deltaproteobacteria bacterium]